MTDQARMIRVLAEALEFQRNEMLESAHLPAKVREDRVAAIDAALATAAEIARVEAGVRYAHVGQRIAEAILSASPAPPKEE